MNCFHEARCLKCAGNHLSGDCSAQDDQENFKCVNCLGNHKSNDKLCPVYIKCIKSKNNFNAAPKRVVNKPLLLNNEATTSKYNASGSPTYASITREPHFDN